MAQPSSKRLVTEQQLAAALAASGGTGTGGLIPINTQSTTSYTVAGDDAGKLIEMSSASANTVLVPTNTSVPIPIGAVVRVTQTGGGKTVVTPAAGVTVRAAAARACRGQYSVLTLHKRAVDDWILSGDLAAEVPSVVQQKAANSGAAATSIPITFSSAPTPGSLLVVALSWATGGRTPLTPAGWTQLASSTSSPSNGAGMTVFTRLAQAGDTSVTLTVSGAGDYLAAFGVEVTTPSGNPSVLASGTATAGSVSLTPTASGALGLLFGGINGSDASTPGAGMTNLYNSVTQSYHNIVAARTTNPAADGITPVSLAVSLAIPTVGMFIGRS